jgi:rhamnogalacturonan endolyase
MEALDRGVVAVPNEDGAVFVSWRLLGTDPAGIAFNLYRRTGDAAPTRLNDTPLTETTSFLDPTADTSRSLRYFVRPVVDGEEQARSETFAVRTSGSSLSVPLRTPDGYTPNDASVGDLDGDEQYEIVLHQVGRSRDNSQTGTTDPPIIQAYELDGTLLWEINLGINIRAGAHYTPFLVYDLDGNGRAEVAMRTADGSTDGTGTVIGNPDVDHRNEDGYILKGPEYLTIFDGETGTALATTEYIPPRHPETHSPTPQQMDDVWGDGYGNRIDRFLGAVAYLDGEHPSLIMTRGYYTRMVLAAWTWRDGELSHTWTFDTRDGAPNYRGQGNHNLSVADVDDDTRDEIVYGSAVIDDDGTGLYSTGFGHGDALHVGDLDPDRPGLEVFNIQEPVRDAGANLRAAGTGTVLWTKPTEPGEDEGPGRANAFNIAPRHRGAEMWVRGGGITGLFNADGTQISEEAPRFTNFGVWWDGDLQRELLSRNVIAEWDGEAAEQTPLLTASCCTSNNGTKATPTLSADLFGDWREEVIWRTKDNQELRIFTSTTPTEHRFVTFMHDPVYRLGIAWQNVGYNQPPHPSFYVGRGMEPPSRPDIRTP